MIEEKKLELFKLNSIEEKLAWIANRSIIKPNRKVIFCFSENECELIKDFLLYIGVKADILKIGAKASESKNKNKEREEQEIVKKYIQKKLSVLIMSYKYNVVSVPIEDYVDEMVFFQNPIFLSNLQTAWNKCFVCNKGSASILCINEEDEVKKYFFNKSEKRESVKMVYDYFLRFPDIYETERTILSNLNLDESLMRSTLRYLLEVDVLELVRRYDRNVKYYRCTGVEIDTDNIVLNNEKKLKVQYEKLIDVYDKIGITTPVRDEEYNKVEKYAKDFLCKKIYSIPPRKVWPSPIRFNGYNTIEHPFQAGIAIAYDKNSGYGKIIERDFSCGVISDELVSIVANKIGPYIETNNISGIVLITTLKSNKTPFEVLVNKISNIYKIPIEECVKVYQRKKIYNNLVQECLDLHNVYRIKGICKGNILLFAETSGSRISLSYCSNLIVGNGANNVYVCTLMVK